MIALASEEAPPSLFMVLTTSEFITRDDLRRDLCQIRRSARRHWPDFEYFCAIEWQQRGAIHVNLMLRGPSRESADLAMEVVWRVWRRRHRAVRVAQSCSPITSARDVAAYVHKLSEYLAKDDQSAPPGWRGHRSSQTRGYLPRPASEMRAEAIRSIRWRAIRAPLLAAGMRPLEASWRAYDELLVRELDDWALFAVVASVDGALSAVPGLLVPRERVEQRERQDPRDEAEDVVGRDLRQAEPSQLALWARKNPGPYNVWS